MAPRVFTYSNPHSGLEPGNLRDAFIVRADERYYLTGTLPPFWQGPCPGVPLWSSRDLLVWTRHPLLIDRTQLADSCWYRDRFWAPEIHRAPSGFYLTFNARNDTTLHKHAIALAHAASIEGPYRVLNVDAPLPPVSDRYHQATSPNDDRYVANDASLFTDTDGGSYLFYSHWDGIWGSAIDLSRAEVVGERFHVAAPVKGAWNELIEGPCLLRHGDWYYCFYSGYSRSYEVGVVRSRRITGPWEARDNQPMMSPKPPVTHAGHNGVFVGPDGNYWISYHQQLGKDTEERLAYDPIRFSVDGWIETDGPSSGRRSVTLAAPVL